MVKKMGLSFVERLGGIGKGITVEEEARISSPI